MGLSTRIRHHFVPKGILLICVLGAAVACGNGPDRIVTSADGVAVHYEVMGRGEPTLVLVHGWTNNRTFWQPHTASLSQSNRVVALDLPGFGVSGTNRDSWTMEQFGQDVVAVIRALGAERVVVVGFSMGGAAVLEAARLVPERIAGVVLVDIFQDPDAKYSESFIEEFVIRNRSSWHDPSFIRSNAFSPETPDSLIRRYIESTPASPAAVLVGNHPRLLPVGRHEVDTDSVWTDSARCRIQRSRAANKRRGMAEVCPALQGPDNVGSWALGRDLGED